MDIPRPELENTVNFLEAASLSASFRSAPRPAKPLKVVIAGAGMLNVSKLIILLPSDSDVVKLLCLSDKLQDWLDCQQQSTWLMQDINLCCLKQEMFLVER